MSIQISTVEVPANITSSNLFDSDASVVASNNLPVFNKVLSTSRALAANDYFGCSVSIDSENIFVGSWGDDDKGSNSGSVYVYDLNGTYLAKLVAPDGAANDNFGYVLSSSCGFVTVGSPYDDTSVTNAGSVYSYYRGSSYNGRSYASSQTTNENFGWSVASTAGKQFFVGSTLSKVYKDAPYPGSISVSYQSSTVSDYYGYTVASNDDILVIGAWGGQVGGLTQAGYVDIRDTNVNVSTYIRLYAPDASASSQFGSFVSIGENRIIVSAYNDGGSMIGSVYIFDTNGKFIKKIPSPSQTTYKYFGIATAVGNGIICICARDVAARIYDLDGNYLGDLPGLPSGTEGSSVAIAHGRLAIGYSYHNTTGEVWLYNIPEIISKFTLTKDNFTTIY